MVSAAAAAAGTVKKSGNTGKDKNRMPEEPCPRCGESIPIISTECVFCGNAVDFHKQAQIRQNKSMEEIKRLRQAVEKTQKGSVGGSLATGAGGLVFLGLSLFGYFNLGTGSATEGMVALGALIGVAMIGISIFGLVKR